MICETHFEKMTGFFSDLGIFRFGLWLMNMQGWAGCLPLLLAMLFFTPVIGCSAPAAQLELGANVNESLTQLKPALLARSHTTWVRGFLPVSQFITGRRNLTADPGIKTLQQCAHDGCKVIVSLKWDLENAGWRVPSPGSETEREWFAWVDALLDEMHGQISILSLANEVFVDTMPQDLKPDANGRIPMVDFLQRLARHVAARHPKAADGQPLPLYCGNFTRLDSAAMQTNVAVLALMHWCATDPQITGVDFHLHELNYQKFEEALDFIQREIPDKPFIVTEYSLIWKYKLYLNEPLGADEAGRAFCARYHLDPKLSVRDFINNCLADTVSEVEWNDFLHSRSWFDPDFLKHTADLMKRHGVIIATYAFSQKGSGDTKFLGSNSTPWLLNPIFVPITARTANPNTEAVNTAWFKEYLGFQPKTVTAHKKFASNH